MSIKYSTSANSTSITLLPHCPHCEFNITFQGTPPRRNTCHRCSPWLHVPTATMQFFSSSNTLTYPKWTTHNVTVTNATFDFKIID